MRVRACVYVCVYGSVCVCVPVRVCVLKANYGSSSQEKKSQQVKHKMKKGQKKREQKRCMCPENGQHQLQHVWQVRANYAKNE